MKSSVCSLLLQNRCKICLNTYDKQFYKGKQFTFINDNLSMASNLRQDCIYYI